MNVVLDRTPHRRDHLLVIRESKDFGDATCLATFTIFIKRPGLLFL